MRLIELFEAIDTKQLEHWTKYASQRYFSSEEDAREFIARKGQLGLPWSWGIDDPEAYYNQLAQEMPVYQTKRGWKIGDPKALKRIRDRGRKRLSWKDIDIVGSSLYDLNVSAGAQEEASYDILPIKMYRLAEILPSPEEDPYLRDPAEAKRIKELAQQIKENKWFEAIYVHENHRYVVEGQHRARAARALGFKTVPGYGFRYDLNEAIITIRYNPVGRLV